MGRGLTAIRRKVKRSFTKDRRRGFVAPTERDTPCPHFQKKWIRLGKEPVVNDMVAICHENAPDCDYHEKFSDEVSLCNRYYRHHPFDFLLEPSPPKEIEGNWQDVNGDFIFQRLFENKYADVQMTMMQKITDPVEMGNFMTEWTEWNEHPTSKGAWLQNSSGELYNSVNQGEGRSAWYNDDHRHENDYRFSIRFEVRGGDNDILGVMFRFNPDSHSFYTFEWDNDGMDIKGMAIIKNVAINPHEYTSQPLMYEDYDTVPNGGYHGSNGQRERAILAHSNINWSSYTIYDIVVMLRGKRIIVEVYSGGGSSPTLLHKFDIVDDDNPILQGAWGPLTWSQPSVFYSLMQMEQYEVVDSDTHDGLEARITLEREATLDGYRVLTRPIIDYFEHYIDTALSLKGLTREDVTSMEFVMSGHNVPEGIRFIDYDSHTNITSNPDTHLGLILSEDDYGDIIRYPFSITVIDASIPMLEAVHAVPKDMTLIGVEGTLSRIEMTDMYKVKTGTETVHQLPYVSKLDIDADLTHKDIQMKKGETIRFQYYPYFTPIEYYTSPYAVDTHDRVYMVKNGEHGWHKWNPYDVPEPSDEEIK